MTAYDYRAQGYSFAGPGNEKHVDAVAERLHYNESIHMHNLGEEKKQHGTCSYCWLRAGRAVRALVDSGALPVAATVEPSAAPVSAP